MAVSSVILAMQRVMQMSATKLRRAAKLSKDAAPRSKTRLSKGGTKELKDAIENNNEFIYRLTSFYSGISEGVFMQATAGALDMAMKPSQNGGGTKHDSGRAAANWHIMVNGVGVTPHVSTSQLEPSEQPNEKKGDAAPNEWGLGYRGSQGKPSMKEVIKIKRVTYGYSKHGFGYSIHKDGWLAQKIAGREGFGRPTVHLINAVYGVDRPAGGIPYHQYAFPDSATMLNEINAKVIDDANEYVIAQVDNFVRKKTKKPR